MSSAVAELVADRARGASQLAGVALRGLRDAAAAAAEDTLSDGVDVRERQERCGAAGDHAHRGGSGKLAGLWLLRAWIRDQIGLTNTPGVSCYTP